MSKCFGGRSIRRIMDACRSPGRQRQHQEAAEGFAVALGAIEKPYTMNGMANALAFIDAVVRGDESRLPPASLVLAEDAYQQTH